MPGTAKWGTLGGKTKKGDSALRRSTFRAGLAWLFPTKGKGPAAPAPVVEAPSADLVYSAARDLRRRIELALIASREESR
jgi:hypothetical protein